MKDGLVSGGGGIRLSYWWCVSAIHVTLGPVPRAFNVDVIILECCVFRRAKSHNEPQLVLRA